MPLIIPKELPAYGELSRENVLSCTSSVRRPSRSVPCAS